MATSCAAPAAWLLATILIVGPVSRAQTTSDSLAASPAPEAAVPSSSTSSAPTPGGITVRATGGLAALALDGPTAFHEAIVAGYRAGGLPVPTQRSFDPGLTGGVDVLWSRGQGHHIGVGARMTGTSAYSLYGDYAGTLDIVSHVRALFVESVSVVELRADRRFQPFVGTRGGTVFATSSTEDAVDLGEFGSARSSIAGRGVGYSGELFGGLSAATGSVELFVQAGYRFARVPRLNGEVRIDGSSVEEGQLPYRLDLSGWTGTVGFTLRRR